MMATAFTREEARKGSATTPSFPGYAPVAASQDHPAPHLRPDGEENRTSGPDGTVPSPVLRLIDADRNATESLLSHYGLRLHWVADGDAIPGSYWGEEEAGVIGTTVYARMDTPVHSLLHEACHLIVLPPERRVEVHTDATDSIEEEDATCYLQIVLGGELPGVGRQRIMADMDVWGYSFRLGSTQAWFERDAENAKIWLIARGLLTQGGDPV